MAALYIDFERLTLRQGRKIIADLPDRWRFCKADAEALAAEYQRVGRRLSTEEVLPVLCAAATRDWRVSDGIQ